MFFVMAIAGMVCTALCVSGQFITDLKAGYWLGSTPAAQEKVKFIGVIAAAAAAGLHHRVAGAHLPIWRSSPGRPAPVLAAPQASIMKALVVGFMSRQPVTYLLVRHRRTHYTGDGDAWQIARMVFALGIYLPLSLTTPILAGGFLSHFVNQRSETPAANPASAFANAA